MNDDNTQQQSVRGSVLQVAQELTHGDRDQTYGNPIVNHRRIAELWTAALGHPVTAQQVAICMALVKVSRLVQTPKHMDSYIDAAAYFGIAAECALDLDA